MILDDMRSQNSVAITVDRNTGKQLHLDTFSENEEENKCKILLINL